jgi:hypothetical protein
LPVGSYKAIVGFNDSLSTIVKDKLTIEVKNSNPADNSTDTDNTANGSTNTDNTANDSTNTNSTE